MTAAPLRVSLLVVAYRMQATIAEALHSALAQTHPCEIIVSDDSSGDATLSAAHAVFAGYSGIHSIVLRSTQRNLGLCAHLNELAPIASGDVLVFLAGDDVAYPQRVASLMAAFAADPQAQLIGSAVDDIDAHGAVIARNVRGLPARTDQRWFLRRGKLQTVLGASMAIRRSLLTDMPPLAGTVEDNMLSLRAALVGHCGCVAQPLLGYRRHADNLGDWVFDRARGADAYARRQRRVLAMYRDIANDQERCANARSDVPAPRRALAHELARMYRIEADMREVILDRPRREWLKPLARGLAHPGLRRKSAERALKLLLPRRWFAR